MSLDLNGLGKRQRGLWHLTDIELSLEPGQLYVLLGPTQAGKTSLMRLMAGLDRPTIGRLLEDGRDVTGMAPQRRRVAMVYQQFINYPSLSVFDNIASPLRRQGLDRATLDSRVRETASLLHIDHLLDRLPAQLSGGQQQRCAIARALVKEASLLLLDEPLVNLDYKLREELRTELKTLFARRAAIVVYATTEPQEALVMGGQTIVMDEGRVLQTGPTLAVYQRPATVRVAEVFSDPPMNMIEGRLATDGLRLGEGIELPAPSHMQGLPAGPYRFGVRSGDLGIGRAAARAQPNAGAAVATVPAEVELAEISGSETFVHLHHNDVSWVVQSEGVHSYALGQMVELQVDPSRLFVFDRDGALRAAPQRRAA